MAHVLLFDRTAVHHIVHVLLGGSLYLQDIESNVSERRHDVDVKGNLWLGHVVRRYTESQLSDCCQVASRKENPWRS